jgi:hypothetical protein
MGWATFWAIFSQTHLVPLKIITNCEKNIEPWVSTMKSDYIVSQGPLLDPGLLPDEPDAAGRVADEGVAGGPVHLADQRVQQAALAAAHFADDADKLHTKKSKFYGGRNHGPRSALATPQSGMI